MNRIFLVFVLAGVAANESARVGVIAGRVWNVGQPIGSIRRPVTIAVAMSAGRF